MADGDQTWAVKVLLEEPIVLRAKGDGEEIERIEEMVFRKPTAIDIIDVGGNPVLMDLYAADPMSTVRFDGVQMSRMFARLSGKPMATIERMGAPDWTRCAWQLSGFFLPARPRA